MLKNIALVSAMFVIFSQAALAQDVLVIAHPSRATPLTREIVAEIFSGKKRQVEEGWRAELLDLPTSSVSREKFYRELLGKDTPAMQALWAELVFSGRAKPPKVVAGEEAVVAAVAANPNALGYISEHSRHENVVVVLRFEVK